MRDSALYRLIFVQPHNGETKLFLFNIKKLVPEANSHTLIEGKTIIEWGNYLLTFK